MPRALLTFLLLALATGDAALAAYRDLAACPDLTASTPVLPSSPAARRCVAAANGAGRRYVRSLLRTYTSCAAKVQDGRLPGPFDESCLERIELSRPVVHAPSNPTTARRLDAAQMRLRRDIASSCSEEAVAEIGLCGPRGHDFAECVLADHREHVQHLLEPVFGDLPAADRTARRCQRAIARAGREFVSVALRVRASCVADDPDTVGRADRCLGSVQSGAFVPPEDPRAAGRLAAAEARLGARIARACSAEDLKQLDACGESVEEVAACVACSHRREALLLLQAEWKGEPDRPTTHFIDWASLRNPILQRDDRMLKNQSLVFHDGWFWVFTGQRFEPDFGGDRRQWIFRTRDFLDYELFRDPDLPSYFGDIGRIGDTWHLTTNGNGPSGRLEVLMATSPDLVDWTPKSSITPFLWPVPVIDGALTKRDGYHFTIWKDRVQQVPYVTRSVDPELDGRWLPPVAALADGFAEALHFLEIDGVQRIVATARDPDPDRCPGTPYFIYTCDHEPHLYSLPAATQDLDSWVDWERKTWLRVPYESWNTITHANSGHLADWREHDGFFYLSYSGSDDGDSFELRGHGKLGLARSRDLIHWRTPGDLRD